MKESAHDVTLSPDGTRILVKGRAIPADKVLAVHIGLGSDIGGLIVAAVLAVMAVLYSLYEIFFSSKSLVWLYLVGVGLVVLVGCLKIVSLVRDKALYVYVYRIWSINRIGPFSENKEADRIATAIAELVERYSEAGLQPIPEELRLYMQDSVLVGTSATVSGAQLTVGYKSLPVQSIRAVKLSSSTTNAQFWAWALTYAFMLAVAVPPFVLMIVLDAPAQSSGDYMVVLGLAVGLIMQVGYVLQQIFAPRVFKVSIQADGVGIVCKTTHKNKAQDLVEQIKLRMERDKYEARTITVKRRDRER